MPNLLKILFGLLFFSAVMGPLFKLPLNLWPVNIYIPDIVALLIFLTLFENLKILKSIFKNNSLKFLLLLAVAGFLSLLISPLSLNFREKIVSSAYLFRYIVYFGTYLSAVVSIKKYKIKREFFLNLLTISGLLLILFGWLQYFLYPDLRNLYYLGWDPHFKRIFSTILDPNYLGLILVFVFWVIFNREKGWDFPKVVMLGLILLTLAFTYSRSSYLALFVSSFYYALKKNKILKYLLLVILFAALLIFLPRPGGEGVKLERIFSVEQRLNNWQNAWTIFKDKPLLGIGFNTLRYAYRNYGFLNEGWLTSHSAGGVDNSFLFVLVTSGIAGLLIFLLFLASLWRESDLLGKQVLTAAIIHSLFLNSLFFIYILIFLWTILALDKKEH